ncbi:rhodanese-like domain-containing protein [Gordonibacter sp. 28C]|nr:rhodanese-like domain-containing protein [Gordonibacter sp. 28C]
MAGGTGPDNAMGGSGMNGDGTSDAANAYHKITAEEGKALMDQGDVTVVDVRTPQEYADGHVPGAVNIPNEDIGSAQPSQLSGKDDKLVVYCRTGVRSKQASDKLVAMGFTDVNDMGGIVDWPYETETGTDAMM